MLSQKEEEEEEEKKKSIPVQQTESLGDKHHPSASPFLRSKD
jgi:hypothetical protein